MVTNEGPDAVTNEHLAVLNEHLGLMADVPRQGGYGPATDGPWSQKNYHHPAAGWGAAKSVSEVFLRQGEISLGLPLMLTMNHPVRGFDCPGCAWPDDPGVALDICENGIKHATWEMTKKRPGNDFFAAHTVTELATWTDFDLEDQGRLTEPMAYDAATDHYVPVSWETAFETVGTALRALDSPNQAAFYTSGRPATKPLSCTNGWPASSGRTTCPIARICVTRRPDGGSWTRSAAARARATLRTGPTPTPCSSSA